VLGTEQAAATTERGDEEEALDSGLELSFGLPADFARPSDLDAAREETMVAGGGHGGTERGRRTEQEADPSVAAKSLCVSGSTTAPSSTGGEANPSSDTMMNSVLVFCVLPHQHTPTRFISDICTKVPYKCSNSNNNIRLHTSSIA
jgi:hypothetical protein